MVDILTRRPNNGASQEICTPENPLVRQLKMGTTVEELADGIIPRAYSDGTPTLAEWRNKLRDAVGLEAAQRSTNGKV